MFNRTAKVPLILQMEETEGGAACLTMILAYYHKWVNMDQVRVACGISRDGIDARNIVRAGGQFGLECREVQVSIDELVSARQDTGVSASSAAARQATGASASSAAAHQATGVSSPSDANEKHPSSDQAPLTLPLILPWAKNQCVRKCSLQAGILRCAKW